MSPTLIMTTASAHGIMACLYHLPHVCHTLVPEIHVCPEMLHVFRYIYMLTCVILHSTEQQERLELLKSTVKIINKDK